MMHQLSRRAHVEAAFQEDDVLKPLGDCLNAGTNTSTTRKLSGMEEAEYIAKYPEPLPVDDYYALLRYLQATGRPYFSILDQVLVTKHTRFLPPHVRKRTEMIVGDRTFSTRASHEGNSAIQFHKPSTQQVDTGVIEAIWSLPLDSVIQTFFVVRSHRPLPRLEEEKAPFFRFDERYCTRIVDYEPSDQIQIIEQQHIIAHLSTFKRPAGTYGIARDTLVICWALNRGRR